jgi:hypothetical protein
MIVFFVTRGDDHTLRNFFETWAPRLETSVRLVHYEDLRRLRAVPRAATYVFTDLERLSCAGLRLMAGLADTLSKRGFAVLNNPRAVLRRYDLLRLLHGRGINPFQVHRALPLPDRLRYPVFLRDEHDHYVMSGLLRTRDEVEQALAFVQTHGHHPERLLIVEYEDVSSGLGVFHRHVGYLVGHEILPGRSAFSSRWIVKGGEAFDGLEPPVERAAAESNAHAPFLRQIARLARAGYGRIDYAVAGGRIYVWELNTNPTLLPRAEIYRMDEQEERRPIADRLAEAFERLSAGGGQRPPVELALPRAGGSLVVPQKPVVVASGADVASAVAARGRRR